MRAVVFVALVLSGLTALAVRAADADVHLRIEAVEHTAAIRRIAVSPDGERIATAGDDKTARVWRASDRQLLAVLRVPIGAGDIGRLYGVAFSPDGRELAVAGTGDGPATPHRIDVFDAEPTPADNPLLKLPNTIVSAHMAGVSVESMDRMAVTTVKNILSVLDGTPAKENAVNKEVFG